MAFSRATARRAKWWAFFIVGFVFFNSKTLVQKMFPASDPRSGQSPCRPDMKVNMLPPASDNDEQLLRDLFTYLTQPNKKTCGKVLRFGWISPVIDNTIKKNTPLVDGQKYACADPEFSLLSTENCIVYSFGIKDDWSFDDDMENLGCQIFSFDPSINITSGRKNGSIWFFQFGIGDRDFRTDAGWEIRTLDSFVHQLQHSERSIQYLKIDVEFAEWDVLRQQMRLGRDSTLFRNVEQIGMEVHFQAMPMLRQTQWYRDVYHIFLDMQRLGFYLFSYDINQLNPLDLAVPGWEEKVGHAFEVVWLKTRCVTAH